MLYLIVSFWWTVCQLISQNMYIDSYGGNIDQNNGILVQISIQIYFHFVYISIPKSSILTQQNN